MCFSPVSVGLPVWAPRGVSGPSSWGLPPCLSLVLHCVLVIMCVSAFFWWPLGGLPLSWLASSVASALFLASFGLHVLWAFLVLVVIVVTASSCGLHVGLPGRRWPLWLLLLALLCCTSVEALLWLMCRGLFGLCVGSLAQCVALCCVMCEAPLWLCGLRVWLCG